MQSYIEDPKQRKFTETLIKACTAAVSSDPKTNTLSFRRDQFVSLFLHDWFTADPSPYLFIFRKSRRVTNISYMELASLIKLHVRPRPVSNRHVQLESSRVFRKAMASLWDSLGTIPVTRPSPKQPDAFLAALSEKCKMFSQLYWELLEYLVLYDAYHGSALIHVPCNLAVDLDSICGESGYVHSCGPALYFRNTAKADPDTFLDALAEHVDSAPRGPVIQLVPYCHEWFDRYDAADYDALRHGLNDRKIYLDKFHIGNSLLVDVLHSIQNDNRLAGRIKVASGVDHYLKERRRFCDEEPVPAKDRTIFLAVEHSVASDHRFPGDEQYIACYLQTITNCSPLIIFNERKPGWMAPVTLPHTLCAAMLNVARPGFAGSQGLLVVDPFLGSGTTLLESQKLGRSLKFVGCDNKPMSAVIVRDNVHFFALSEAELETLIEKLSPCGPNAPELRLKYQLSKYEMPKGTCDLLSLIGWALNVTLKERESRGPRSYKEDRTLYDHAFSERFWGAFRLEDEYFTTRLIFYVCWRAIITNTVKLITGTADVEPTIRQELQAFYRLLESLKAIRQETADSDRTYREDYTLWVQQRPDTYSKEAILPFRLFEATRANLEADNLANGVNAAGKAPQYHLLTQDAETVLGQYERQVDLIITDPPYGFNTDPEDAAQFADFYRRLLRLMVRAVKPNGQIVLCLPRVSRTGQAIPYFATKKMVIRQLILEAEMSGLHVVEPSLIHPTPRDCFVPPFYWHSERALTRDILHFCFSGN